MDGPKMQGFPGGARHGIGILFHWTSQLKPLAGRDPSLGGPKDNQGKGARR